ncbi:MAG: hypothetical protein QW350_00705 [Candidatus Aenigmatarchaeota archaeon]
MSVKILIGDKGYIDFEKPVRMNEKQKDDFINLLKNIFSPTVIIIEEIRGFRNWRIGEKKSYPREWTAEEYEILLNGDSHEEIAKKLGRSPMSVLIRDGVWRPKLLRWCQQKNKNLLTENNLEIIKEFLKENEDLIKKHREEKKKKRIEEIIENLEKKKKSLEKLLHHKNPNVREYNINEYTKIEKEIKKYKKRLGTN